MLRSEFICVATGNGHCVSDKLVSVGHNACDGALGMQRLSLGVHTIGHVRATGV